MRCEICGASIARGLVGRPPKYCPGNRCRQQARYLRQHRAALEEPERWPGFYAAVRDAIAALEARHAGWREANR